MQNAGHVCVCLCENKCRRSQSVCFSLFCSTFVQETSRRYVDHSYSNTHLYSFLSVLESIPLLLSSTHRSDLALQVHKDPPT